jgi:hypothetical protein
VLAGVEVSTLDDIFPPICVRIDILGCGWEGRANDLAHPLGGGTKSFLWIRTTFEMPIIQIRGKNPAKSVCSRGWAGFSYDFVVINITLRLAQQPDDFC